jgi:hypothetical protein
LIRHAFFLFGEAEKGTYCQATPCLSLIHLWDTFGSPPVDSKGLLFAIQALMFDRELLFFRVREEGFSKNDYFAGFNFLKKEKIPNLAAICMPGTGDRELLEAALPICALTKSLLILNETDLYDFLSS